jgi:hypothetical protein
LALAVTSSCARRTAGGDVLSTRSTGIAFWWWWSSCCRAATAALLAAQCSMAAHGRSGSLTVLLGASARADGIVPAPPRRRCACFDSFASQPAAACLLVSYTASSACCRSGLLTLPVPFSSRNSCHTFPFFTISP